MNNKTKYFKLFLPMLLIICLKANSQSIPGYLPEWFHDNFSTTGGESSGKAIAYYGDNIYVTGYFFGDGNYFCHSSFPATPCSLTICNETYPLGLSSTPYNGYRKDAFIANYCSSDGGLRWIKVISGCPNCADAGDVRGMDVTVDDNGNPVVVGYFESTDLNVDGNSVGLSNSGATGTRDIFVMQFDPSGNYTDGIAIGNDTEEDNVYGVVTHNGEVYICGSFKDDLGMVNGSSGSPPLAHSGGGKDIFIIKIPSDFNSANGISRGGSGDEEGYDIDIDNSGNVFVTGSFESDDGDFLDMNHGGTDMFLSQINYSPSTPPCSLAWGPTTVLGGGDNDYGHALDVNSSGAIYVAGAGKGPMTINSSATTLTTPFGDVDVFVSRYTVTTLAHNWTHFVGGSTIDVPTAIATDGSNSIIVTGHIPGNQPQYTTSSTILPQQFQSNSTNPLLNLCPGNQPNSFNNSFMVHYSSNGNTASASIFSSTYGHSINSITVSTSAVNGTSIYYTGHHQGSFSTGSSTSTCNCFTCNSNSTSNPAAIVSNVHLTPVCTITPPFTTVCSSCQGCTLNVQIYSSQQSICTGTQVQFQDITNYTNWGNSTSCSLQWSFPGGTVISNSPPIVQYNAPGTYSVTLTLNCNNNASLTCSYTGIFSNYITVTDCSTPVVYNPGPDLLLNHDIPPCTICPCTTCPVLSEHISTYEFRDLPCETCIQTFELTPGKKYQLSAWAKEKNPCYLPVCNASISLAFPLTSTPVLKFRPSGKIIDGWQRIEATFLVPVDATSIQIFLSNSSANTADEVYFDDIRIHPFDANMKSYVYDPVSLRLVSELDENNYATFYEYDEEGKLARVKKETERGIATIKESRVNTKKN